MIQWISANWGNAVVLAVLILAVIAAVAVMRRDRKKGGCCGSCSGYSMSGCCHGKKV